MADIQFSVTDATGDTIAVPAYNQRRQALLRIVGSRVWVNFNAEAVAGECQYIDEGDSLRFWGDRATANVYLVCESGETATAYVVEGATNMEIEPGTAKSSTGGTDVEIVDVDPEAFKDVSVQYPLPVDSDSVYVKDVDLPSSTTEGFTGGTTEDLFNSLFTTLTNSTTDDPKTFIINFCRPLSASGIAIGDTNGGTHSGVKVEALRGGTSYTTLNDNSTSTIPFNSRFYSFSTTVGNENIGVVAITGLRITFNTTSTVSVSFLSIQKTLNRLTTLQGLKPDGVTTFIGATNNSNLEVSIQEYGDTPSIDPFDRLRTSDPFTLFDSKQLHDKQPLFWDEEIGGNATSVHSTVNAEVKMSVTANAADYVIRQTKQRPNYQPGKGQEIIMTFHSPQATGIVNRVGVFDGTGTNNLTPNNGIFFECDGAISWNIAKYGTITETVAQSSWNVDPLDGTGTSGKTLDMTAAQIMIIDFEWLGVGRVRVGFVIDGLIFYCHYFNHANVAGFESVYMSTPNLPLRYSIETDGTSASHLDHICSTIMSEGGVEKTGVLRSVDNGTSYITGLNTGVSYAMLGIRLKLDYLDVTVIPENISLIAGSNDDFRWQVQINPTVAGTFTYNDLDDSAVQWANGTAKPTVTTDGIVIGAGYSSKESKQTDSALNTALKIGTTIAGLQDTLVLVVTPLSSNLAALSAMTFRELL